MLITPRRLHQPRGFTIAELMVAMIIAILIIIIVGSTFVLNQKVFRSTNTKAELTQNARITIDVMSREIRQAQKIVTSLPPDNSNPAAVAHELRFQDGHIDTQIQYIRYYLNGSNLQRQLIAYYFSSNPNTYVHFDDVDAFGPPQQKILEDKIIGEFFSSIDFYGDQNITIDMVLNKTGETIKMESIINPRNL